ncbi:Exo_endo_phos domain-containing protein [Cephalotus follicularis]|uniref:Exo_endo_phos domain-containing protein n=1 Tax=Cephalotus follicularis TaxID=3775 RepID=A0A1Q3CXX8_CEPFO|nr:Exo_endo_phos domain-containing protein [Cephalotus follicularis]
MVRSCIKVSLLHKTILFHCSHPSPYTNTTTKNLKKTSHFLLLSEPTNTKMSSSSWSCKKCTFINTASQNPTCQICLTPNFPPYSPSPSSAPKWPCKSCTFLNPYKNVNCEICGARAFMSSFEDLNDIGGDDVEFASSVGSVFLPLQPCSNKRKIGDPVGDDDRVDLDSFRGLKAANKAVDERVGLGGCDGFKALNKVVSLKDIVNVPEDTDSKGVSSSVKILSYNVWFREDLELRKRMKALGDLIELHSPDIICFQEVTSDIYDIFRRSSWWKIYQCSISEQKAESMGYSCMQLIKLPVKSFRSIPFRNSIMGRELCITEVEVQGHKPLVVATSHLESPCPGPPKWDQMYSKERVDQAKEAINLLKSNANVIFGGDMNWDDKLDGPFPLLDGWIDAWVELRPGEIGWTYDTKSNQMLSGNRTLQKRLDRFVCNLRDYKISEIDMIGKEAIPGLSYCKEKKMKTEIKMLELPVLPSDHYGLLLTISRK